MLQQHSLGKSCCFLFVPHEINSQPDTEGEPSHEAWRKIQFLTYLSRISHKKLHAWSFFFFFPCMIFSFLWETFRMGRACFCFPLVSPFLSLPLFSLLRVIPTSVFSLHPHLAPQNRIYFSKYSVPGSKHWLSDSAFLTTFPWPGTDADTRGHTLNVCWRNDRWKGYVHPL